MQSTQIKVNKPIDISLFRINSEYFSSNPSVCCSGDKALDSEIFPIYMEKITTIQALGWGITIFIPISLIFLIVAL